MKNHVVMIPSFVLFVFCWFSPFVMCQPHVKDAQKLMEVKMHPIFTSNSYARDVVVHNNAIYMVWVDDQLVGRIARLEAGDKEPQTAVVIPKHLEDTHNGIQMGIDKDGYIHVVGDMHHSPLNGKRERNREYLDVVWQYWVSEKPGDISRFRFVGNTAQAPPGTRISYAHFITDNKGELYMAYRNGVIGKGYVHGVMAGTIAKYDTRKKRWSALGGQSPFKVPATVWTPEGIKKGVTGYQSYKLEMMFDRQNHLHVVWTNFASDSPRIGSVGAVYLLYAKSKNAGRSWNHWSGKRIGNLPITHQTGEVLQHVKEGDRRLASLARITMGSHGEPVVYFIKQGTAMTMHPERGRQWSDAVKTQPRLADVVYNQRGDQFFVSRGRIWVSQDNGASFKGTAVQGMAEAVYGNPVAFNREQSKQILILDQTATHELRLWRLRLE